MQAAASYRTPSLEEHAAALRAHVAAALGEGREGCPIDGRDPLSVGILRQLDVAGVIALVDRLAYPAGSIVNIHLYKTWLELCGSTAETAFAVWYNLGVQYNAYGDAANTVTSYKNALALKPDLYQATLNLGLCFEAAGDADLALSTWRKALQPDDARTALLNNCGRLLENCKKLGEAERTFTASLLTAPDQPDVLHHWLGLRTRMCTWPIHDAALPGLTPSAMRAATRALTLLALCDDVERQDRGNASWIAEKHPPAPLSLRAPQGYGHRKLRIGYMSSDFCMHPMAYLVAELFEQHDRAAFQVFGYCSTKEDGSAVRQRILRAFDTCVAIDAMTDEQAARRIRNDEIDILIDLNGLTLGTRLQVMRWRPAPVQITYLGYNGPVPLPELDYILADSFVIPRAFADAYRPKPLYMPRCYQVNDSKLPITLAETREDAGLPADKFVFCCFSNTYKITETIFDAWMSILQRAPDTVLWLFVDNPYAEANLQARAARAGLAPERLIFASRVEASRYRGRLALADLFLDTYPYNAGTTASDALRVGLPLITLSGQSFTARMAGSLLKAMNLEDGIVYDHASYVELAVTLATDADRYSAYRARVTPEVWRETLGDTAQFCSELEVVLTSVAKDHALLHRPMLETI